MQELGNVFLEEGPPERSDYLPPNSKEVLPIIKGGADAYVIGKKGIGKTAALVIHTIHKLKAEAFEDSPRALFIVENQQKIAELKEEDIPMV